MKTYWQLLAEVTQALKFGFGVWVFNPIRFDGFAS